MGGMTENVQNGGEGSQCPSDPPPCDTSKEVSQKKRFQKCIVLICFIKQKFMYILGHPDWNFGILCANPLVSDLWVWEKCEINFSTPNFLKNYKKFLKYDLLDKQNMFS